MSLQKFPIKTKRIYDPPATQDGFRILIDRLWPRGVTKAQAKLDFWHKEIAPSNELRKWFNHKAENFNEFERLYKQELKQQEEILKEIKLLADKKPVTLLYGAKDPNINQAVVLKKVIEKVK